MTPTDYIHHLVLSHTNIAPDADGLADILAADAETRALFSRTTPPVAEKPPQAVVDVGSLLSFVDGVGSQERDDVLYSVQLAQRGASGTYNRFTQTRQWYGKYVDILEKVGWTVEQIAFTRHDQSEGEVRMDKASLAVIAAIATQNQLAVLKESVAALTALAEADGTIRLFDFHTLSEMSGNFQIGAVQKSENNALSMALGAFYFSGADARRKLLFFSWGSKDVAFWTAAQKMTLNTNLYAGHRNLVREKLGAAASDFISGLELG